MFNHQVVYSLLVPSYSLGEVTACLNNFCVSISVITGAFDFPFGSSVSRAEVFLSVVGKGVWETDLGTYTTRRILLCYNREFCLGRLSQLQCKILPRQGDKGLRAVQGGVDGSNRGLLTRLGKLVRFLKPWLLNQMRAPFLNGRRSLWFR